MRRGKEKSPKLSDLSFLVTFPMIFRIDGLEKLFGFSIPSMLCSYCIDAVSTFFLAQLFSTVISCVTVLTQLLSQLLDLTFEAVLFVSSFFFLLKTYKT